jgi:hypothetical protein
VRALALGDVADDAEDPVGAVANDARLEIATLAVDV